MSADDEKIGKRHVDGDELRAIAARLMGGIRADDRGRILAGLEAALRDAPRYPRLMGGKAAAAVLGVAVPNVSRMRERGTLGGAVELHQREQVVLVGDRHRGQAARSAGRNTCASRISATISALAHRS